jgi:hypothetical protein
MICIIGIPFTNNSAYLFPKTVSQSFMRLVVPYEQMGMDKIREFHWEWINNGHVSRYGSTVF